MSDLTMTFRCDHCGAVKHSDEFGTLTCPQCGSISWLLPVGEYRQIMLERRARRWRLEHAYFNDFASETLQRFRCSNCGAVFLAEERPHGPMGETVCCAHCIFNPLGCRCKYGEYGVAEGRSYDDGYDFEDLQRYLLRLRI